MTDSKPPDRGAESSDLGIEPVLSSRQAADLLGVHESSVKRWCNRGELGFQLTVGGHRRIRLRTVLDFARAHHTQTRILSFPGQEERVWQGVQASRDSADYSTLAALAYEWVEKRAADRLTSLWELLREAGVADVVTYDRIVAPVMRRIGTAWEEGSIGTGDEHRMTNLMQDSLRAVGLSPRHPNPKGDQTAVVGCAPGEPHEMGAMLVRMVLEDHGWDVVYLGADVPAEDFAVQQRKHNATLVCVSISPPRGMNEARALARLLAQLYDENRPYGLALGGGGMSGQSISPGPFDRLGQFSSVGAFADWLVESERTDSTPPGYTRP